MKLQLRFGDEWAFVDAPEVVLDGGPELDADPGTH
jgi:hypothetical protein